LVAYARFNK